MEGYNKLTTTNHPKHGDVVTLFDGTREITAKWWIDRYSSGFTWIPRYYQGGICLMSNPTHWKL